MFYVRMTDKAMSGWGAAVNRNSVLVVECDDYEQAVAIEKAAKARPEMRRVMIVSNPPRAHRGILISRRHFSEMGGPWLDYYGTKVVRSLMSGKEVVIRKDTPLSCDPSSETYWSM